MKTWNLRVVVCGLTLGLSSFAADAETTLSSLPKMSQARFESSLKVSNNAATLTFFQGEAAYRPYESKRGWKAFEAAFKRRAKAKLSTSYCDVLVLQFTQNDETIDLGAQGGLFVLGSLGDLNSNEAKISLMLLDNHRSTVEINCHRGKGAPSLTLEEMGRILGSNLIPVRAEMTTPAQESPSADSVSTGAGRAD